jgi:hypothetical protein
LSAVLRLADGLDRGHTAAADSVRAELTDRALLLTVRAASSQADLGLECWGASRKADVMAKLLGRDVVVTDRTQ